QDLRRRRRHRAGNGPPSLGKLDLRPECAGPQGASRPRRLCGLVAGSRRYQGRPLLVTGGSFVVDDSGSATLTMTTGVDPREFRTMEITAQSPGNGALS